MRILGLLYETRRRLAILLAAIRLHGIEPISHCDGAFLWKRRRRAGSFAIRAGNIYLRMQRADVEILTTDQWLRWEVAAWSAKAVDVRSGHAKADRRIPHPDICSRGLIIPLITGEPLTKILGDSKLSIECKLQSVGWALRSLDTLHGCAADWGNGLVQQLSHGDATVGNVIIDPSNQSACWIDFDTRHRADLPTIERRADDLRALIFSSAIRLTRSQYPLLIAQLYASYRRREVIAHFRKVLASEWHRPTTFQLAQAPLPRAAARALRDCVASCD